MVVALPWLALSVPSLDHALAFQLQRAFAKFAVGHTDARHHLTATVTCDEHGAPDEGRDLAAAANASFQFVVGRETADTAHYATADGSVVRVDFLSGHIQFTLNEAVFDAPYSTWADLCAAPLAATWRYHGYVPLHAAAVSLDEHSVLVVGASGSGKTTTSLALATGDGVWRADDKVLLRGTPGGFEAASLYANTNLAPATIAAHAPLAFALERPPINDTNDKRACQLDELGQRIDLSPFTPSAIVFPRQVDRDRSSLRRLSSIDVVMRLAAQSPTGGDRASVRRQHQQLVALATHVPAWELEAGRDVLFDPLSFATALRRSLAEAAAATPA